MSDSVSPVLHDQSTFIGRYEAPEFCVGENAFMTGASVVLIVGSVVLVATAIALTILFPPAGAVAVACIAVPYVFGGGFGIAGVGLAAYVFHKYRDHVSGNEIMQSRSIDESAKAQEFASSMMATYGKELIENPRFLYEAHQRDFYERFFSSPDTPFMNDLKTLWLSHELRLYDYSQSANPPELIAHYLALLFCKKGETNPKIPLLPLSIDEWKELTGNAKTALSSENAKTQLIADLQSHFQSQPRCVKEYLILYCLYLRRNGETLLGTKKVPLFDGFSDSLNFPFYRELGFEVLDYELAKFIIIYAEELFPEEFRSFVGQLPPNVDEISGSKGNGTDGVLSSEEPRSFFWDNVSDYSSDYSD